MKTFVLTIALFLMATVLFNSCQEVQSPENQNSDVSELQRLDQVSEAEVMASESLQKHRDFGHMAIANRASGTISLIRVSDNQVANTVSLPSGGAQGEPMYVVWQPNAGRVFVGDRANNRIVVFDDSDYSVETTVPAGAGVFHMWADLRGRQLWVVNDIDKTLSVISPRSLQTLATVPIPADLASQGGKPHDVIVSPGGYLAYTSIVGIPGDNDFVVQYNTRTFQEIGRATVDKDPHLSLTFRNRFLYVPCQNGNSVIVLNRFSMERETTITAAGAHGAGMPLHGKTFYTTNLPGGGTDGLHAIDTRTNTLIGSADTPVAVPHNIALPFRANKLYVTHSGATADKVTVYRISKYQPIPVFEAEVTVGLNPFGLAFTR